MQNQQPEGWDRAREIINANTSPRYKRLEELERWVSGTQYDSRPDWFCPTPEDVPLWERRPCVVYPVAQIAIQSNTDLVLGEGRFPVITSKPGEDEGDDEAGIDEDQSAALDRFVVEYHKLCRFRAHSRDAFNAAQGAGTTVAIHGIRDAKPFVDAVPAKWCAPEFALDARTVTSVEIRYPFVEEYRDRDGKWKVRVKLYRRVIDEERDTTYLPADARDDGEEPKWQADKARDIAHRLGLCPVVWYPFMRGSAPVNQIDGHAVHALILDEIQAHDIAISQRHRCALYSEPQICEIGVEGGYSPTATGYQAMVPSTPQGGHPSPHNPINGGWGGQGPPARKKGPSHVWQYPNPLTKVETLTIGKDALEAQAANASDIRIKLQEALCVVFLDPESIKFAATTSGKALEAIKQKQIDRCDQFRDDLKDNFLLPSVNMQLRIAHTVQARGERLDVPGAKEAQKILDGFADPSKRPARKPKAEVEPPKPDA
jgi:hypothetical protein